jgi:hypothetical protein
MPGESGKIPIKVGTAHYSGPVTKSVTVMTNVAGAGQNIQLQIKGELWQVVQVTPNAASFGRLTEADAKISLPEQKLAIVVNTEAKASITDVKCSNPQFTAEVKEVEPGKKFDLLVKAVPPLKSGNNFGTIDMNTGVPEMPTLKVTVSAFVAAELEVMPQQLVLGVGQKVALTRQIFIRNNSKTPVNISDVACSNPAIKLDLRVTSPGTMYQINVNVPAEYAKTPEGDRITFKTDKPGMTEVVVPIIQQPMPAMAHMQPGATGAPAGINARPMGPFPQPGQLGAPPVNPASPTKAAAVQGNAARPAAGNAAGPATAQPSGAAPATPANTPPAPAAGAAQAGATQSRPPAGS